MRIIAADTSGSSCSLAILEDGKILASVYMDRDKTHSENFEPLLSIVLKMADIKLESIDVWAIITGPGSYTGLRISIAAFQVYALLYDKPCVALSSLELIAWPFSKAADTLVFPFLDARNQRLYGALYHEQSFSELESPLLAPLLDQDTVHIERLLNYLVAQYEMGLKFSKIIVSSVKSCDWFIEALKIALENTPFSDLKIEQEVLNLDAKMLALLAFQKVTKDASCLISPAALQPDYLSKTQAERQREEKLERGNSF